MATNPDDSAEPGVELDEQRLQRLLAVEREYTVTIGVLAVVVEMLLLHTGGDSVEIADDLFARKPDLKAWRNVERRSVEIVVSR